MRAELYCCYCNYYYYYYPALVSSNSPARYDNWLGILIELSRNIYLIPTLGPNG